MNKVSVIIPTMRGREELLKKLLSTIPSDCEVIVVDDEDLLLAAKRNKGAKKAKGEYLLFIDDDNYLKSHAIYEMLRIFNWEKGIGVVGMTACYDDKKLVIADGGSGRNYLTGFTTGKFTNRKIYGSFCPDGNYQVDEVANAFMIHSELFYELHGFDEKNFPIDLDEADLCKRVKDMGYKIMMCPAAICYHKSQTYSPIPNFRRPLNAYCMGNHRIRFQRKHNSDLRFWLYLLVFMPLFVGFYALSLIWKRNPRMIKPFLHGVMDGLFNRRTNQYQKK